MERRNWPISKYFIPITKSKCTETVFGFDFPFAWNNWIKIYIYIYIYQLSKKKKKKHRALSNWFLTVRFWHVRSVHSISDWVLWCPDSYGHFSNKLITHSNFHFIHSEIEPTMSTTAGLVIPCKGLKF